MSIVRPDALDYLSGLTLDPTMLPPDSAWPLVPLTSRRLIRIRGVGVTPLPTGSPPSTALGSEALLAGLAAEGVPVAFQVRGLPDGVSIDIGTWDGPRLHPDRAEGLLVSLLESTYAAVTSEPGPLDPLGVSDGTTGAIVVGVPHGAVEREEAPWDRLARALRGLRYVALVLAEPVPRETVTRYRDSAYEDLRLALAAQHQRSDQPLTQAYVDRLTALVQMLDRAVATGAWRTGTYLLAPWLTLPRVTAAWQGVLAGVDKQIAPLRSFATEKAGDLAAGWSLPNTPGPPGPRAWSQPYLHQTLLDSRALASVVHLPRRETSGFTVRPAPSFGAMRATPAQDRLVPVGAILADGRPTGDQYVIGVDDLSRHVFVAGLTGSGKTHTVKHVLAELAALDVPFLVIEPAKTEYRDLLGRGQLAERLRVYTPGRENVAPLRLNPFEVPPGTDVSTHLDLLKAVFQASMAMWVPLPHVLEQCLVELYTEHGWDFTTGRRDGGAPATGSDVPTLGELVAAVQRTVPQLGYKGETAQDITGSLVTRLSALRRGTRGLMFDVERSVPTSDLLAHPTIVELEGLGDDGDKAFAMGLLLIRLYEHRRAEAAATLAQAARQGDPPPARRGLEHLVVVEEAHRLLAKSEGGSEYRADPQGAFADTFSQMLSEIRAYGQGIVIADQVPVRLAPDVVKNTNLKVVHRLVAGDDRDVMAAAMAMSPAQSEHLAVLGMGRAAVFSEGDHTPVIVAVAPPSTIGPPGRSIDDNAVASVMSERAPDLRRASVCDGVCSGAAECLEVRRLGERPDARLLAGRVLATATVHPSGLDVVWPDVVAYVGAGAPSDVNLAHRVHAFAWHALRTAVSRRALQGRWPADDVDVLWSHLRQALAERATARGQWQEATTAREQVVAVGTRLQSRTSDPLPLCREVCKDSTCRFRDPLLDVLTHPSFQDHAARAAAVTGSDLIEVASAVSHQVLDLEGGDLPQDTPALVSAGWSALACAGQIMRCRGPRAKQGARAVAEGLLERNWELSIDALDGQQVPTSTGGTT
ncbi:ATP-binding protein [Beutenbergia cavernae]|uniref:ATP-binding protein n=1 Tax=Beutenbergia cavernae TaxID=84757 RepID=UPI00019ACF1C|nr:DUF87 domain-containing protein [Beutenbergia cavernae]